jgi:DNA polymerase (family X)
MRAGSADPSVAELLDVDREYRRRARSGELPFIAPRRFNPEHDPWLPVLHTTRGTRKYTALFSNTAQAHRRHRTHDWVVLYHDAGGGERQCTVVTEYRGALRHRRVVRGREPECAVHYAVSLEPEEEEVLWFEPASAADGWDVSR